MLGATAASPRIQFFTNAEFALVTELAEVIWPTDDLGPGAREAGVAFYIDGQLAGAWGTGDRWYMQGPFLSPSTAATAGRARWCRATSIARAAGGRQLRARDLRRLVRARCRRRPRTRS